MKNILSLILLLSLTGIYAQSPVGKWKKITHVSTFEGQTFDSHIALLTQRPCAAKIVYEINAASDYKSIIVKEVAYDIRPNVEVRAGEK